MIILLCAHVHIAAKRHVSSAASLSPLSEEGVASTSTGAIKAR